jgi:hypothetical protein
MLTEYKNISGNRLMALRANRKTCCTASFVTTDLTPVYRHMHQISRAINLPCSAGLLGPAPNISGNRLILLRWSSFSCTKYLGQPTYLAPLVLLLVHQISRATDLSCSAGPPSLAPNISGNRLILLRWSSFSCTKYLGQPTYLAPLVLLVLGQSMSREWVTKTRLLNDASVRGFDVKVTSVSACGLAKRSQ